RRVLAYSAHAQKDEDRDLFGAGILDVGAAVSHAFWSRLTLRVLSMLGLALLLSRRIRRHGGQITRRPAAIAGALLAGVGLFPLAPLAPFLSLSAAAGTTRTLLELAMRPLGEWDAVLLGLGFHKWLLLESALPAVALAALGFASRRMRPFIGGVALGTAALLAPLLLLGDAAFVGGAFLLRLWAAGSAGVCLWLARVALDAKRG
ncbi:MAG: hypothetical protein JOZ69_25480, partial [Myxococcales bacterium]|nr:hypothetical protein [Myxococcales bacterium]